MVDPSTIRLAGPLAAHRHGLWTDLLSKGYTPLSSRNLLYVFAHLSRWLKHKRLQADALGPTQIKEFLRHRLRSGYTHHLTLRGLQPLMHYLRGMGVLPPPVSAATAQTSLDRVLWGYERYLLHERALVRRTVEFYQHVACRFLTERLEPDALDLAHLSSADVTAFVLREARSSGVGYAKLKITALRALLRYLYVRGDVATDLRGAAPTVAGWRLVGLPRALAPEDVDSLLRHCDRRTHLGQRDFAALLLLARLGLRASEVANLGLDDVHWACGEIVVRGKGAREARLPLPHDVGEAMVSYLRRGRPRTTSRKVFVQSLAPYNDLSSSAVTRIVRAAGKRAGLVPFGAHRLRHTLATQMLRHGASLSEIAQVLRHRSVETTTIYAKVDRDSLRDLSRPWPEAAP